MLNPLATLTAAIGLVAGIALLARAKGSRNPAEDIRPKAPPAFLEPYRKRRVLLVDDDPDFALSVDRILSTCGFRVNYAASAEDARTLISSAYFDYILCDQFLENELGTAMLHRVLGNDAPRKSVIVSGTDRAEAFRHDPDLSRSFWFLKKPCSQADLLDRLEALEHQRRRSLQNRHSQHK